MTASPLQTVVVTGGAQGIGAAICVSLAAQGARIAVCDTQAPDATIAMIEANGGEALGFICDVSRPDQVQRAIGQTLERFGHIDGLVNNAAIFASIRPKPIEAWSSDEFDQILQVNVRGTFEMIKAVASSMRARGKGKIVNVSSGTAFKGTPMMLPYVSSKGAVIALTRAVARELGPHGICVNCVAPGFTVSDGTLANATNHESGRQRSVLTRCLAREQMPGDLTGVIGFLLSEHSDFMTGQTLVVDGGSVMN